MLGTIAVRPWSIPVTPIRKRTKRRTYPLRPDLREPILAAPPLRLYKYLCGLEGVLLLGSLKE
jgi:hypothetical protein